MRNQIVEAYEAFQDLDAETPGKNYEIAHGHTVNICVNDWVDLDSEVMPEDPLFVESKQVTRLEDDIIYVRLYNLLTDEFEETAVSPSWVHNCFRRI